jgi:hypothetical protein
MLVVFEKEKKLFFGDWILAGLVIHLLRWTV